MYAFFLCFSSTNLEPTSLITVTQTGLLVGNILAVILQLFHFLPESHSRYEIPG